MRGIHLSNFQIENVSNDALLNLIFVEWADYKQSKGYINSEKAIEFIKHSISKFQYYNIQDIIELYFLYLKENNIFRNSTRGWESSEPGNINRLINVTVNPVKKILLLLFDCKINDIDKLRQLGYIKKIGRAQG